MPTINGTPGDDVLVDTNGQDTINGLAGDDTITVTGPAFDQVDGGDGIDTLIVQFSNATGNVISEGNVRFGGTDGGYYEVPNREVTFSNIEKFQLYTGSGADTLVTGDFQDLVSSGAGNDDIDTRKGIATVDGGTGIDLWRADFTDNATAFTLNLNLSGNQAAGNANGTSVTNIERVLLTLGAGNDVITTASSLQNDMINGGGGDDTILSAGGSDNFAGGAGTDLLIADFSAATTAVSHLREVDGAGTPTIKSADNVYRVIYTSFERFDIRGGSADDVINTADGSDFLSGGAGNDFLNSFAGQAVVDGGADQDAWYGDMRYSNIGITLDLNLSGVQQLGNGSSVANVEKVNLVLGDGNDTIVTRYGANNLLVDKFDQPGDGTLGLRDVIDAGGGDDVITTGGGGAYGDVINGGSGIDTLIIHLEDYVGDLSIVEGMTPGSASFGKGPNMFSNMERLQVYAGAGNDQLQTLAGNYADIVNGGGGNDNIFTFGGNDQLFGGAGDDVLAGGSGADVMNGGTGIDTANYQGEGGPGGVIADLNGGASTDTFGATDTLINIENVNTTAFADTVYGSAAANVINAGDGADTVFGGSGVDVIHGNQGNDVLVGNADIFAAESDQLFGDEGNDLIYGEAADTINGGAGFDSLIAINSYDFTLNMTATSIEYAVMDFGNDTITAAGGGPVSVFASGGNDTVTGSGFQDLIFGGVGNDVISGGDADDAIVGEAGVDSLDGGAGDDRVYFDAQDSFVSGGTGYDAGYVTAGSGVTVNMAASSLEFFQDFAGGNDTVLGSTMTQRLNAYTGGGNDTIVGTSFDDVLWGEAGNDTISGGNGVDVIVGGAGADVLSGGQGFDTLYGNSGGGSDGAMDVFKFADVGDSNYDAVFDFVHGEDKLDFTAFGTTFASVTINNDGGSAEVFLNGQRVALVVGAYATLTASDFIFTSSETPGEATASAAPAIAAADASAAAAYLAPSSDSVHAPAIADWMSLSHSPWDIVLA